MVTVPSALALLECVPVTLTLARTVEAIVVRSPETSEQLIHSATSQQERCGHLRCVASLGSEPSGKLRETASLHAGNNPSTD